MVPAEVALFIKTRGLFGYQSELPLGAVAT